jgi:hypothetical protein
MLIGVADIHLLLSNGVMLIGVVDIHLLLSNGVMLIGGLISTFSFVMVLC